MIKNITLSADETLIRKARQRAAEERKSLNELFRGWVARYAGVDEREGKYRSLMRKLSHVRAGKTFSREEMNER